MIQNLWRPMRNIALQKSSVSHFRKQKWDRTFLGKYRVVCIGAIASVTIFLLNVQTPSASFIYGQPANVPATYYGEILASASEPAFTPAVGMSVEAVINGQVCGTAETQEQNGVIVYVIKVLSDNIIAGILGCGNASATITFLVDQTQMQPTTTWDNSQTRELNLLPTGTPAAPIQVAPNDTLVNGSPAFEWESVAAATNYELVVYNISTDTVDFSGVYSAGVACNTTPCAVTPSNLVLSSGDYSWLIRAINGGIVGPWSVY